MTFRGIKEKVQISSQNLFILSSTFDLISTAEHPDVLSRLKSLPLLEANNISIIDKESY